MVSKAEERGPIDSLLPFRVLIVYLTNVVKNQSVQVPDFNQKRWHKSPQKAIKSTLSNNVSNQGYFMENACVRFLFTSCEVS